MKKRPIDAGNLYFLLTLDTINNYLDRMTLSVVLIVINQSFEVIDSQYAFIIRLFTSFIPSCDLVDAV